MKRTTTNNGFVLKTQDEKYLRFVGGNWGPKYLDGDFDQATIFDNWAGVKKLEQAWGAPLKVIPVIITTVIQTVEEEE